MRETPDVQQFAQAAADLCGHWLDGICVDCIAKAIAAAEERGRRAGVEAKDAAYAERNQCVALLVRMALALGWRAGVRDHEDKPGEEWESDWRSLVCIDLPSGQVSWHFHDSEKRLLAGLPQYPAPWDGHDTPEKYRRVNAGLAPRDSGPATGDYPGCDDPAHDCRDGVCGMGPAPRDSAPECGHLLSRDLGAEWRCGKPAGHEGPHSGTKP